jgi:hypothetical protein
VDQLLSLFLNSLDDFRVAVSGRTNRDPGVAIQKDIAVNILNPDTLGTFSHQFERGSRVGRINVLGISLDDRFAFRSW